MKSAYELIAEKGPFIVEGAALMDLYKCFEVGRTSYGWKYTYNKGGVVVE